MLGPRATCWTLRKANKGEACCTLWDHPLGWELRLIAAGRLLQSQVFRSLKEFFDRTDKRGRQR